MPKTALIVPRYNLIWILKSHLLWKKGCLFTYVIFTNVGHDVMILFKIIGRTDTYIVYGAGCVQVVNHLLRD